MKRINCEFGAEKKNEIEKQKNYGSKNYGLTILKCCFPFLSVKTTNFIGLSALMTSQEPRHTQKHTVEERERERESENLGRKTFVFYGISMCINKLLSLLLPIFFPFAHFIDTTLVFV